MGAIAGGGGAAGWKTKVVTNSVGTSLQQQGGEHGKGAMLPPILFHHILKLLGLFFGG